MRPGLMGLPRAQGMGVPRKGGGVGYAANLSKGATAFVAPSSGRFKFHAWGGGWGGDGASGGASGSYLEITRNLAKGQVVAVTVGVAGSLSTSPGDTTLTFPNGSVATAAAGASRSTGGVATGGDVNLNGSAPGTGGGSGANGSGTGGGLGGTGDGASINGGAGAPGVLPMSGGRGGGGGVGVQAGASPGGGGRSNDGGGGTPPGGSGLVIVVKVA